MPNIQRVGDLEIAQDLDFQRRSWIMQRVGWVFIALVALAALLGLAGQGPYTFLLFIFRIAGRRTLSQMTNFDLVLLLLIGESTQQGLLGNDFSLTNAFLVVLTLVGLDIAISLCKQRSPQLEKFVEGVPLVIVEDGKLLKDRMYMARVDESDILTAARIMQGLERLEQIKYAVLERSGSISIIPKQKNDIA